MLDGWFIEAQRKKAHLHRVLSSLAATTSGISSLESGELKFLSFKIFFFNATLGRYLGIKNTSPSDAMSSETYYKNNKAEDHPPEKIGI